MNPASRQNKGHREIIHLGAQESGMSSGKEGGWSSCLDVTLAWGRWDSNALLSHKLLVWPGESLGLVPFPLPSF